MTTSDSTSRRSGRAGSFQASASTALSLLALMTLGVSVWGATMPLSGAVIAPARITVEHNLKRVQAAATGPLAALHVRNGDRVDAGQLLMALDGAQARAALDIILTQHAATRAQLDRLVAERDGAAQVSWSDVAAADTAPFLRAVATEKHQFELRLVQHETTRGRLRERHHQLIDDEATLRRQQALRQKEERIVRQEYELIRDLRRRQLTPITRYLGIQRDVARLDGDIAALTGQLARVSSQARDVALQLSGHEQTRAADAQREATAAELKLVELAERRLAAEEQVRALDVRAPVAGVVHELSVHGVGAVLRAGETALVIVPDGERLVAELQVRPEDIDQVSEGQEVRLRMTAFNQRTTPQIPGRIVRVAAETSRTSERDRPSYAVIAYFDMTASARGAPIKLIPGMPVEALIQTGERTLASYLLKPMTDHMQRALIDD